MTDQFILTPYFIDRPVRELAALVRDNWRLNGPSEDPAAINSALADKVAEVLQTGNRPVSVAGDCVATIGVVGGLQRAKVDPVLVWLDAHGDFNTRETSPSGFLGGMPLAMLTGRGDQRITWAVGVARVRDEDVFLSDARDLDPLEREALADSGVTLVPDVAALPDALPKERPLYVHFDVDVLDPADAPSLYYPAPGGISAARLDAVFASLAATGRVVAVSLSAWDAEHDTDGVTRRVCMSLLDTLLGR